jgi:hypothetical protein
MTYCFNPSSYKKVIIRISAVICILFCIGDITLMFFFSKRFPGYSQLTDTISSLGTTSSPVGNLFSVWWVIMGFGFIFFSTGFGLANKNYGKYAKIAAWLIALYGFGEGLGSGLFRADHIGNSLTTSAIIHDIFGGVGVAALLFLPLVMQKIFTKKSQRALHIFFGIIFYLGIITWILFLFRYVENTSLSLYKGLWQRLSLINYYLLFIVIAIRMLFNKYLYPDIKV